MLASSSSVRMCSVFGLLRINCQWFLEIEIGCFLFHGPSQSQQSSPILFFDSNGSLQAFLKGISICTISRVGLSTLVVRICC